MVAEVFKEYYIAEESDRCAADECAAGGCVADSCSAGGCAAGRKDGGYVVYMLCCADGSLYTGMTNDMEKRLKAHNSGTASKCTRSKRPVSLAYLEEAGDRSSALKREAAIKKLRREQKLQLIEEYRKKNSMTESDCDPGI